MARKKPQGDVQWYFPKKKRPFFRSTMYASNSIRYAAIAVHKEIGRLAKINEVRNYYWYECEESKILDKLIEAGYGDEIYFYIYD